MRCWQPSSFAARSRWPGANQAPSRARNRRASRQAVSWPTKKITCTGSAGVVKGEPSLSIIGADGDLSGNYKLDATITTEEGETKANVATANGGAVGGKVVPGKPLHINADVGLDDEDEHVPMNLKVLGKRVKNLRYETKVLPR